MRSSLEIFDTATGTATPVFQTESLIEAPNWSPDGRFLVFNGDGRLFRLVLDDDSGPQPIDTGFATRCNNDHGLSPDGTRIVISDSTEDGRSCIYTLPVAGGAPTRVTDNRPSYWHGWSPDGRTLAYCAERAGRFDIFTIPVAGGTETRLTDGAGHSDGPDYTPDGAFLWFNSSRDGVMRLWRMRPDGSDLQRMTDDDRVSWFPHPAPDGASVLYLAFAPGTEGHPPDRDVELRLMPAAGGPSTCLLPLFGGQGTINVPCWAPDSRRFAFVRYTAP